MKARSRARKSPSDRSASRRRRVCAAVGRATACPSRLAAMRAFAVSHSASQGRITTGSMICMILSRSV